MPKKITDLPSLTSADSTDIVPLVDQSTNTTKQTTVAGIIAGTPDGSIDNDMLTLPWVDFTPTVTVKSPMTISAVVTEWAKYRKVGKKVEIDLQITFTLGGTASNEIYITPPVAWDADVYSTLSFNAGQWFGTGSSGSTWSPGIVYGFGTNNKINFLTQGSANFATGTARTIKYRGEYIIA